MSVTRTVPNVIEICSQIWGLTTRLPSHGIIAKFMLKGVRLRKEEKKKEEVKDFSTIITAVYLPS